MIDPPPVRTCRDCDCTEDMACIRIDPNPEPGRPSFATCTWEEEDLCTACLPDAGSGWTHPDNYDDIVVEGETHHA